MALLVPRRHPIRFDREKELAYTWHKGKFFVADIGPYLQGLDARIEASQTHSPYTLYGKEKSTGPVAIRLSNADNPEEQRVFRIGLFPVAHAHQNIDLKMLIAAFMEKGVRDSRGRLKEWNGDWLNKLKPGKPYPMDFMRKQGAWSLIRHDYDEEKTEAAILEYLTHPDTRCRSVLR